MAGKFVSSGFCHQVEDNPCEIAVFGRQPDAHDLSLFDNVGIQKNPGRARFRIGDIHTVDLIGHARVCRSPIGDIAIDSWSHVDDIHGKVAVGDVPQDFVAERDRGRLRGFDIDCRRLSVHRYLFFDCGRCQFHFNGEPDCRFQPDIFLDVCGKSRKLGRKSVETWRQSRKTEIPVGIGHK